MAVSSSEETGNNLTSLNPKILDKEKQNILIEILRCAICLEIPKGRKNLKVRTCEKGHHFCSPCFKKLHQCAICRGRLSISRNFVVEELITKLGPFLGIIKHNVPQSDVASNLPPSLFKCLHQCSAYLRAGQMLNHIRRKHSQNLVENVRSNPYNKRFDWVFEILFELNKLYTLSVQISDMGLFTVVVNINDIYVTSSIQMLANNSVSSLFHYKLTIRINRDNFSHEFSVVNCEIFNYNCDKDVINTSKRCLKLNQNHLSELLNQGEKFQVYFSIWRKNQDAKKTEENFEMMTLLPDVPEVYKNEKTLRRTRQRNFRKRRLKEKIRVNMNFYS